MEISPAREGEIKTEAGLVTHSSTTVDLNTDLGFPFEVTPKVYFVVRGK